MKSDRPTRGKVMSFRQHNKNPDAVWRNEHREELLRAGMPDFVLDDERRWHYVLLHGADEFESGWEAIMDHARTGWVYA